jgi:CRP/FNR family cyclic AMP-dependent transcriptional regulator
MPPRVPAIPPHAELPPGTSDSLQRLAARGVLRRYRKGVLLIQEGEHGDTIYILVQGRVRVYAGGDDSKREITYGVYGPGEFIGEMSLDGGPRSANVLTLEPCVCSVITRETLLQHIAVEPEFALQLITKLIRRVRAVTLSARQMALNDVYGRLRALLDAGAWQREADGAWVIHPRPTHLEVASQLGCSREMVSRLLKDLERGGMLTAEGNAWVIRKPLPMRW